MKNIYEQIALQLCIPIEEVMEKYKIIRETELAYLKAITDLYQTDEAMVGFVALLPPVEAKDYKQSKVGSVVNLESIDKKQQARLIVDFSDVLYNQFCYIKNS